MAQQKVRRLTDSNNDGIINWTEKVTDPNGQSVDIDLFVDEVIRDGQVIDSNRRPSSSVPWLSVTTTSNTTQSGATEVSADISVDTSQIQIGTEYKLELEASDSNNTTPKEIHLRIGQTVTTGTATADFTSATLSGTLDTLQNRSSVNLAFDYGPSGNVTANRTTPQTVSSTGSFSQTVTGLDQAVDYEFRIVAIGQAETVGDNATFTTDALEVSTTGSSAIGAGTATVEGNVDALNDTNPPADVSFNFGIASPDTNQSAGTAGEGQAFTTDLTGLQPGETYQFQARGVDSGATGETDVGQNLTFTTQNVEVSVVSISSPNPTELSVEGSLDTNETSSPVSLSVEYKKQSDSTFTSVSVGNQTATGTFTQAITGLEAGVTYDVRVSGDIDTTTVLSGVQVAETEDVAVSTVGSSVVGAGNATLEGDLTQLASDETATVSFDFGPTGNPNQSTSGQTLSTTGTFTETITGLDEDSSFEFRANVQADGSGETDVGDFVSFTTQNVGVAANSATPTGPDAVDVTGEVVVNETGNAIDLEIQHKKSSETSFTNTTDAGTQSATGTFTQSVSGLEAGIDYDFRVVGTVDTTTITSGSVSAETQEVNVSTTGASSVDTDSVVLEGSLDEIGPSETDVDVKFQYGTPGNVTMLETSPVSLSSTGAFSETVSGLAEDTQFEFRAVATGNPSGDQDIGQTLTFTTANLDNVTNSIAVAGASEISAEGEITNYAREQNVSVFFEYRKTGASSFSTESAGTLSSPGTYTASITGLEVGAEYEARAVAEVESTRVEGALQTVELDGIAFSGAPSVTSKTTSSVTVEAVVDELQASTTTDVLITYSEQGGTDSGSVVAENISQTKTVSAQITGLNVGSTYDLQAEATVDGRTITSATQSADLSSLAVSTKPNTATSATNVTLNGSLDSLESGQSATVSFQYGDGAVDDNETSGQSLSSTGDFSKEVTGLAADTQYEYRAKGFEGSDIDFGQIRTFTTDTIAVSAEAPSSIGAGAATLEGQIDVLASSQSGVDAFFEYGKQSGSVTDNSTATQTGLAQGDSISQSVTGLEPGATYEVRVVATANPSGDSKTSPVQTFTTDNITVSTTTATPAGSTSFDATGNLDVNETGGSVSVGFEYSTDTSFDQEVSAGTAASGSFSATVSGLTAGTTYNVRAYAESGGSRVVGSTFQVTTRNITVSTEPATSVNVGSATLEGNVDNLQSGGGDVQFEYGKTQSFGSSTVFTTVSSTGSFSEDITGLQRNEQYFYRIRGESGGDVDTGSAQSFTTDNISVSTVTPPSSKGVFSLTLRAEVDTFTGDNTITAGIELVQGGGDFANATVKSETLTSTGIVEKQFTGLSEDTSYDFKAFAEVDGVRVEGSVKTDSTLSTTMSISPTSHNFGTSDGPSTKTFTVTNTGTASLSGLSASGLGGDFSENGLNSSTLSPGGSTNVTVTYDPSSISDDSDTLNISANETASASASVSGNGIPEDPSISVSPSSFDFGTASASETKQFTITNDGNVDLGSVSASGLGGDFSSNGVQDSFLTPGEQTTITVSYDPTSIASDSDTLSITTDSPDASANLGVAVNGDGIPENPDVSISPTSFDFGTASGSETKQFTVTNDGNIDLTGLSASGLGGDFSEGGIGSSTLSPGSDTTVTVTYNPSSISSDNDTLNISANESTSASANVSGDGIPENPEISISLTSKNFGTGSGSQTFTLTNDGNVDLDNVSASGLSGDFSENGVSDSFLTPGEQTTVTVSYNPSSINSDNDTLNISTDRAASASASVSGDGIPENPSISISPNSHDFGTGSGSKTFTLENTGNVDLGSVSASGLSGDFSDQSVADSFLTPGETTTVTVDYNPSSIASDSGTLNISTDRAASASATVSGDGVPENPSMSISPMNFNFGTGSGSQTFTLENTGNVDLGSVSASGLSGDFSENGVGDGFLTPGESTTVTVDYDPSTIDSDSDTLNISTDRTASASASLSGDGVPENPQISISPGSHDFGTASGSETKTFTVTNTGNVNLGSVSASGLSGDFSEGGVGDSSLAPNESTNVTVTYNPSSIVSDSDTLNISTNRSASAFAGVSGDGIPENPQISISPTSFDFGTGSGSKTFTIENTGNVDLGSVSASGLSGDFSENGVGDGSLTPGESTTVTVDYNPSSIASDNDTLNISTDRAASASAGVNGDGVPENPNVSISPNSHNFGTASGSETKTFTVTNTGNVNLGSVSAGGLSGDFSENGVGDSSLAPNESTNVTVTYNPNDISDESDTLDISTNRSASVSASVSGDGVPENPQISISPNSHNFGTVSGSETKTFTIENTGNVNLNNVSASGLSGDFSEGGVGDSSLAPNESTNVTVTYNPNDISDESDTLDISTNRSANASANVSGDGIPEDPSISVSPSSHDFGTASGSETKTFTVTNTGNVNLGNVSASGLGGDFSEDGINDTFLTPGDTANVTITYNPTSIASDSDTLSITTDRSDASANLGVAVNGDGIPENPDVSISPTNFNFGTESGSNTKTFTITNTGNVNLDVSAGGLSGDFSEGGVGDSFLTPNESTNVTVTYNPNDISDESDTLNISTDRAASASANVSGDGVPENPSISISPGGHNFGTASGSESKTFTIENTGNVDLGNVSAGGLSGDFSENGVNDSFLTPGDTANVTVDYNPSSIASDSDMLNISTDRSASASANVSGDGIPEDPKISISPGSHDFGTGSGSTTFTITNTGNVDLGNVSASGLGGDFSENGVDSFLTPGEQTTVTVDYNPSSIASDSDTLNISTNRSASASANVSGDGVPENPSVSISPNSHNFGTASGSETKTFTVTNTGNVNLGNVTASGLGGDFSENGVGDSFLTPNESTNVTVTYNPNDITSDNDTLNISTNRAASASASVSGDGVPENPSMSISPNSHNFGTASGSETKTFTVTNTGNVDLGSVSAGGLGGDFFENGVNDSFLTPGDTANVTVTYSPNDISGDNDTLNILTNRSASAFANVSGDGVPEDPSVSISPNSHDFGTDSGSKTFTIENTGNVDLDNVGAFGLSGEFSQNGVSDSFLTPGEQTTVTVDYNPIGTGSDSDTLNISTDRSAFTSASVSGDGVSENPSMSVSPTSHDFGTVDFSDAKSFTLTNTGNVSLTGISGSGLGNEYSIGINTLPSSLSPGQSDTFDIQYTPSGTSGSNDTFNISANQSASASVSVFGSGTSFGTGDSFGDTGGDTGDTGGDTGDTGGPVRDPILRRR